VTVQLAMKEATVNNTNACAMFVIFIYIITLVSPLCVCLSVCVLPNSSETVGRIDFIFGHDIDPIPGMVLIYFS